MKYKILLVGNASPSPNINLFSKFDHQNIQSLNLMDGPAKEFLCMLQQVDFVATLENWQEDPEALKAVQIARLVDKPVIHHSRVLDYVQ